MEITTDDSVTYKMFDQDVLWNFEDVRMLHGTDLPIFGGDTYPCISLRLRNMSKPIRVLSGIDYWLDNLMSYIPEVTMFYHSNSFVQNNELVMDEDLPNLNDSRCSPKAIRRIAQSVLSFLKLNITKPGHTYWLSKGKNNDIVKLYDLSSICSELLAEERCEDQNSFTVPVAMLFYRVARNLIYHPIDEIPSNPANIKILLNNCLKLLNKIQYPQIVTSVYYMLSDFYIPFNTDPVLHAFEDFANTAENLLMLYVDSDENLSICSDTEESIFSVDTHDLCFFSKKEKIPQKLKYPPSEIKVMPLEERCQEALYNVCYGLSSLHYIKDINQLFKKEKKVKLIKDKSNISALPVTKPHSANKKGRKMKKNENFANKNTKNKNRKYNKGSVVVENDDDSENIFSALLCKSVAEIMPTWHNPPSPQENLWKQHLNTLFYEKACLAYVLLAENNFKYKKYGKALKYYHYLFKCWMCTINANLNVLVGFLLERTGNCCLSITRYWNEVQHYKIELDTDDECNLKIREVLPTKFDDSKQKDLDLIPININSKEDMLNAAVNCYQRSVEFGTNEDRKNIMNKIIGIIYGLMASEHINEIANTSQDMNTTIDNQRLQWLLKTSKNYLLSGINKFENTNDLVNLSLLHSRMGELFRYVSCFKSFTSCTDNVRYSFGENKDYSKMAIESYIKSLAVLGNRRLHKKLWDVVFFDLSSLTYCLVVKCQSNPSEYSDRAEAEKETLNLLLKALKYCDLENNVSKKFIYLCRAADIHNRLGSLYHNRLKITKINTPKFKTILSQSVSHYNQSFEMFLKVKQPLECLCILVKNIALDDIQIKRTTCSQSKVKFIMSTVKTLENCVDILKMLFESEIKNGKEHFIDDNYNYYFERDYKMKDPKQRENKKRYLLETLEDKLKNTLMSMIKLSITKLPKLVNKTEQLKKIYEELLRKEEATDNDLHLLSVIIQIKELNL